MEIVKQSIKRKNRFLFAFIINLLFVQLSWIVSSAYGITRVIVQNNTTLSFSVNSKQTGYPLDSNKWGQVTTKITPGQRADVVWFNRDDGIKTGKEFFFTSHLSNDSIDIYLKQALKGAAVNSHMWQSLTAPGVNHGWFDDRKTRVAVIKLNDGRDFRIKYRAFFTGTDDNIEYILLLNYQVPNAAPTSLNLLAYNIYMRPVGTAPGNFMNGQYIRARLLPPLLTGYDVIVFSEAFDDDVRNKMLNRLKPWYPYTTRILGSDRGVEQDGGVIIVSHWPIESQDQILYKDDCSGTDCLADKGVLYARINKKGYRYHIFGSHTQADSGSEDISVRKKQFKILKSFIDAKNIPSNEPVIIAGDLNVDKTRYFSEYKDMLNTLNASQPATKGHSYSFDPKTNDLASSGPSEYLDYVLYSNKHPAPKQAYNDVRMIRSDEEWKEFTWEDAMWDLSDHYAVFGRFDFGVKTIKWNGKLAPKTYKGLEREPIPVKSDRNKSLKAKLNQGKRTIFQSPLKDKIEKK